MIFGIKTNSMQYLQVPHKSNLKLAFTGMDCVEHCVNQKHFVEYQKPISYEYNSLGFRDREWPQDTKNAIWCVGDSFTTGLGQPWEETWPSLLENTIQQRCFNIGEDGCSNDLMALRTKEIFTKHQPKLVIIMWSYLWRRYIKRRNVRFNIDKKEMIQDDFDNLVKNISKVSKFSSQIIQLAVPNCGLSNVAEHLSDVAEIKQLDESRDGHHFDIKTSISVVNMIESHEKFKVL